jgi:hypothetical protein
VAFSCTNQARKDLLNRRTQRGIAATTAGYRIGVSAYGRTGENDVVKPQPPERNPRENARSPMTVDQRSQRFLFRVHGERPENHRLRRGAIPENKPVDSVFEYRLVTVNQQTTVGLKASCKLGDRDLWVGGSFSCVLISTIRQSSTKGHALAIFKPKRIAIGRGTLLMAIL